MNIYKVVWDRPQEVLKHAHYRGMMVVAQSAEEALDWHPCDRPILFSSTTYSTWPRGNDLDQLVITKVGVSNLEPNDPQVLMTDFWPGPK